MDTFISELDAALKYAHAVGYNTSATAEAGGIARQIANGDDTAIGVLSDFLKDHDHPAAEFIDRIRDGHAIEGPNQAHYTLQTMHAAPGNGGPYDLPDHYFVLMPHREDKVHPADEPTNAQVKYLHLPDGHFVNVVFGRNYDGNPQRSFIMPVSEDDVRGYAEKLRRVDDHRTADQFEQALVNEPKTEYAHHYPNNMRDSGLGHLLPADAPVGYADISDVLKYVSWDKPTDVYPQLLQEPVDAHLHAVYADWLQDRAENPQDQQLAERVRKEAHKSLLIDRPLKPAKLNDDANLHDFVLHAIRTGHQNPTVRAMAGERVGDVPHPELVNFLLHSDHPHDKDVAIWLAPDDAADTHAAHSHLKRLNSRANEEAGLQAKVVRGTVFLLDHEQPDHRAYGAPQIVYTAPANDFADLRGMEAHATQLRSERTAAGPATHIGPAVFGS